VKWRMTLRGTRCHSSKGGSEVGLESTDNEHLTRKGGEESRRKKKVVSNIGEGKDCFLRREVYARKPVGNKKKEEKKEAERKD